MWGSRSAAILALAAAPAAGCGDEWSVAGDIQDADTGGTFAAAEWHPSSGTSLSPPASLAVGGVLHVVHSSGDCVESIAPQIISSSDCGELLGIRPGFTTLYVTDHRGRLHDHQPLEAREVNDLRWHARVTRFAPGRSTPDRRRVYYDHYASVAVPFDGHIQVIVLALDRSVSLLGSVSTTLTVVPLGALHVVSYGRYYRFVCLRTGTARVEFIHHERSRARTGLTIRCLEPGWEETWL